MTRSKSEVLKLAKQFGELYEQANSDDLIDFANAIAEKARDDQREIDAKICDERSSKCAAKADRLEDADDIIEQKSLAWQFSVLASIIRTNKG